MRDPLFPPDLRAAWRRARSAGRPRTRGWPMALGVLWVMAAFAIALVLLLVALVTAVTVGAIVWLRRRFRGAPPAPLGHRPHGPSDAASARWPRAVRRPPSGEIVDIEAREIPDSPPGSGR
ncbi:MAG: hypothetical protein ABIO45_04015 [Burkholderiaceae bacterium]